ncbi:MAG: hypothetical protein PUD21_04000, partial [Clostridiaceae bacterium]|nr:hypothetical protein [Clostridiaceae bacterium]
KSIFFSNYRKILCLQSLSPFSIDLWIDLSNRKRPIFSGKYQNPVQSSRPASKAKKKVEIKKSPKTQPFPVTKKPQ